MSFILQSKCKIFLAVIFGAILTTCVIVFLLPLIVFSATSENYKLDQEGVGFVEFDGSSNNFEFKAAIGLAGAKKSTSANYIVDQGRVWAVTETPPADDSDDPDDSDDSGGGGGGGGGIVVAQAGATFSGRAYPLSSVRLLKDGQIVATTITGPNAIFSITISGINIGNHIFTIVGIDYDGLTSQSQSFPVEVGSGVTVTISGIFLAPTLAVDKSEVRQGDNLAIFGQTVPESVVTIGVASQHETFRTTSADVNGVFLYNLDTAPLLKGDHETRAKSTEGGAISNFGRTVSFVVGSRNVFNEILVCVEKGDMNGDCRVSLVDFSIAAFWYEKDLNDSMKERDIAQLNGDGVINLIDLSIMAFYWTG